MGVVQGSKVFENQHSAMNLKAGFVVARQSKGRGWPSQLHESQTQPRSIYWS
jgi:hypothetical protein